METIPLTAHVNRNYLRQPEAIERGAYVAKIKEPVVGNQAFAILLADDPVTNDSKGVVEQMAEIYEHTNPSHAERAGKTTQWEPTNTSMCEN